MRIFLIEPKKSEKKLFVPEEVTLNHILPYLFSKYSSNEEFKCFISTSKNAYKLGRRFPFHFSKLLDEMSMIHFLTNELFLFEKEPMDTDYKGDIKHFLKEETRKIPKTIARTIRFSQLCIDINKESREEEKKEKLKQERNDLASKILPSLSSLYPKRLEIRCFS